MVYQTNIPWEERLVGPSFWWVQPVLPQDIETGWLADRARIPSLSKHGLSPVKSSVLPATVGGPRLSFPWWLFLQLYEFSIAWDGGINPGSWGREMICRGYSPVRAPSFKFYSSTRPCDFLEAEWDLIGVVNSTMVWGPVKKSALIYVYFMWLK